MTRQTTGAQNLDTYYVYDDAGQLRWVVTPEGSAFLGYYSPVQSGAAARYSGDISSWTWTQYGQGQKAYAYTYDGAHRLTAGQYYSGGTASNALSEKAISYDRAGNITALTRHSSSGSATTLSYSYTGNRRSTFAYDVNGNVTNDATNSLQTSYNLTNRWRFSGKEGYDSNFGIAMDDFGARLYDRSSWTSIDPLAEKYYSLSPYAYCAGNPVNFVDPEGTNPIYSIYGELLGTDDNGLQGEAIIMERQNFSQGMRPEDALRFRSCFEMNQK